MLAAVPVGMRVLRREIPLMIGFSLLLVALSAHGAGLSRIDGAILIAALVAFSAYMYAGARRGRTPAAADRRPPASQSASSLRDAGAGRLPDGGAAPADAAKQGSSYARSGLFIGAGAALLGVGAWLAVENAVVVAGMFGMSDRLVGITVIAIGTSAPELITSVIAVRRGHADIGIGNIIGSNVYNVLMITGVAAAMAPIAVDDGSGGSGSVYIDYAVMIAFSLALLAAFRTGSIRLPFGAALAASYAAYLAASFLWG